MNLEQAARIIGTAMYDLDKGDQLVITRMGRGAPNFDAKLCQPGADDPHVEIFNAPSVYDAIVRLACVIQEEQSNG